MEDLAMVISAVFSLFRLPFTVYGFEISLWQVFCFTVVSGIVVWVIREVLSGE